MESELIGIEAATQLVMQDGGRRIVHICSDNMEALTASQNMTKQTN